MLSYHIVYDQKIAGPLRMYEAKSHYGGRTALSMRAQLQKPEAALRRLKDYVL